jgi:uroporphyrinogen decarboxylase
MDARQNFLRLLHFDSPEAVISELPVHFVSYTGMNHEDIQGNGGDDSPVGTRWRDIWGTGWHKVQAGVMGMPEDPPLAQHQALRDYHWPDPEDERITGRIDELAKTYPGPGLLLGGGHRDTLWEKAYMLVGMEKMMEAFLQKADFAREVLHRIMDFQLGIARRYLALGVEIVFLGDDLGTQTGALLGPRIVSEFLLPEYRRIFELYKRHGVLIDFHSCGNLHTVLDMFLELGVDLLNPLQATANDLDWVREKTQGRMALRGGVSSAVVMAGPPERIQAEVHLRIAQLGAQGGYVCQPDQGMPYPEMHLAALRAAVQRYGRYPVKRLSALRPPQ